MKLRKITEESEVTYKLSDQATLGLRDLDEDDFNLWLHITKKDGSDYRVSAEDTYVFNTATLDRLKSTIIGLMRKIVGTSIFNTTWNEISNDENSLQGFADIEDQIKKAIDTDKFSKFYDEFKKSSISESKKYEDADLDIINRIKELDGIIDLEWDYDSDENSTIIDITIDKTDDDDAEDMMNKFREIVEEYGWNITDLYNKATYEDSTLIRLEINDNIEDEVEKDN